MTKIQSPEQFAAVSQANLEKLVALANSALSRAEEGRVSLDRQPIDLGELVAGAVERLRPQTDDAGIELRCTAADGSYSMLVHSGECPAATDTRTVVYAQQPVRSTSETKQSITQAIATMPINHSPQLPGSDRL